MGTLLPLNVDGGLTFSGIVLNAMKVQLVASCSPWKFFVNPFSYIKIFAFVWPHYYHMCCKKKANFTEKT